MPKKYFCWFLFLSFIFIPSLSVAQELVEEFAEEFVEPVILSNGEAFIEGTKENSALYGIVYLTETIEGVTLEAYLYDVLGAGKHGFHVHEFGSCEEEGKAAGGHYNPRGADHGLFSVDGIASAHMGDLGNITIDENGEGELFTFLPGTSLSSGEYNLAGRAIILHEKEDDFGQPTGNAGGRIGCGTIVLTAE